MNFDVVILVVCNEATVMNRNEAGRKFIFSAS